jgi:hypothetical protein
LRCFDPGDSGRLSLSFYMSALVAFNVAGGFTLVEIGRRGPALTVLLSFAFALHILRTDKVLTSSYEDKFTTAARAVLSVSVLVGASVAVAVTGPHQPFVDVLAAFVVGGVAYSLFSPHRPGRRWQG